MRKTSTDRRQILDSAIRLFRANGYHATSMQDIADDVGILKGSLYHHIRSKEELLVETLEASVDDLLSSVNAVLEAPLTPRERLRRTIAVQLEAMARHQSEILIWLTERRRAQNELATIEVRVREVDALLRQVVEQDAAAAAADTQDSRLLFEAIRGMLTSFPSWYRPKRDDVGQIAETFADFAQAMIEMQASPAEAAGG